MSPPMSLDNLPPELCERIFRYACTDDGTTGRSLSLVSKYIRNTSAPHKFQSISIAGAKEASIFVKVLKWTPYQLRRVSYLSITNDQTVKHILKTPNDQIPSHSTIGRVTTKAVNVIPGVRWYKDYKRLKQNVYDNVECMRTNRQRDESIFCSFLQIIHLTARTLRTLEVHFESGWKMVPARFDGCFAHIRFLPLLTSLTVDYYALFHSEVDEITYMSVDEHGNRDVHCTGRAKPMMPLLKYLDLGRYRVPEQPIYFYDQITRFAPNLTHLRLPMRMTKGLRQALGLTKEADKSEGPSHANAELIRLIDMSMAETLKLPESLQRIFIQLEPPPEFSCCDPHETPKQRAYTLAVEKLRDLEREDERIVVLDSSAWGVKGFAVDK